MLAHWLLLQGRPTSPGTGAYGGAGGLGGGLGGGGGGGGGGELAYLVKTEREATSQYAFAKSSGVAATNIWHLL